MGSRAKLRPSKRPDRHARAAPMQEVRRRRAAEHHTSEWLLLRAEGRHVVDHQPAEVEHVNAAVCRLDAVDERADRWRVENEELVRVDREEPFGTCGEGEVQVLCEQPIGMIWHVVQLKLFRAGDIEERVVASVEQQDAVKAEGVVVVDEELDERRVVVRARE